MNLEPAPRKLEGVREMKVKIPLRLHISLHSLKLLSGRQISDIVTEALQNYLATTAANRVLERAHHEGPATAGLP